jgi:hypothetical protein
VLCVPLIRALKCVTQTPAEHATAGGGEPASAAAADAGSNDAHKATIRIRRREQIMPASVSPAIERILDTRKRSPSVPA